MDLLLLVAIGEHRSYRRPTPPSLSLQCGLQRRMLFSARPIGLRKLLLKFVVKSVGRSRRGGSPVLGRSGVFIVIKTLDV